MVNWRSCVNAWTQKSDFPQGNFLCFLTQPEIKRQRPFEHIDIEYDQINGEISRVERVKYNAVIGINVMNADDIEYFEHL